MKLITSPWTKKAFLQSKLNRTIHRRLSLFCLCFLGAMLLLMLTGCASMAKTAQKISDDLGDKALQAHAFVDVWQITPSDPATNSAPTGKKITVIGDIKSIPLVSKKGEMVKDYAEYRKTITPAWYNSSNVTTEESFICTGDNVKELKAWVKQRQEKAEAEAKEKAINPTKN